MLQHDTELKQIDRRIACPHWGVIRARYHFAARFVRNKHVLEIAPGGSVGNGILLQAGALSVTSADLSQVPRFVERLFDVVVCVEPGRALSMAEHGSLKELVSPGGHLIVAARAPDLRPASPQAWKFRQVSPSHARAIDSAPRPLVTPSIWQWLSFLIRDALVRLVRDRGVYPGEYDFEFHEDSAASDGTALVVEMADLASISSG